MKRVKRAFGLCVLCVVALATCGCATRNYTLNFWYPQEHVTVSVGVDKEMNLPIDVTGGKLK